MTVCTGSRKIAPITGLAPRTLAALAVLTIGGLALRIIGVDQTLFGDEYFTFDIVVSNGLGGVWDAVYNTSITPPLHYAIAWAAVQLGGDETILVRIPSLLAGTALVPVVFDLGRRAGGARAGLIAAALAALSPFVIYYSDEARTYAVTMLLVAVSTAALLRALEGRGRRWWVLYAVCACAVLWSHYTAVFVVVGQAAWALWAYPEHRRGVLVSSAAIVAGFLPWVPGFLKQRDYPAGTEIIDAVAPSGFAETLKVPVQTLVGHPGTSIDDLPGVWGLMLLAAIAAVVVAALVARRPSWRLPSRSAWRSPAGLFAVLALATLAGLLLYSAGGTKLYVSRNLSASLPAAYALIGAGLARASWAVPRPVALAAFAVGVVALVGASIDALTGDLRRPPFREAVTELEAHVAPSDPVVERPILVSNDARLRRHTLDLYFDRPHRLFVGGVDDGPAWAALAGGRGVWLVTPSLLLETAPAGVPGAAALNARLRRFGGPDGRAVVRSEREFDGLVDVSLVHYRGLVRGRLRSTGGNETIQWSSGPPLRVARGGARGAVDRVTRQGQGVTLSGWALDARRAAPAEWVMVFAGDELVALSPGGRPRPDLAPIAGAAAPVAGFARTFGASAEPLRAFAVTGRTATELPFTRAARTAADGRA